MKRHLLIGMQLDHALLTILFFSHFAFGLYYTTYIVIQRLFIIVPVAPSNNKMGKHAINVLVLLSLVSIHVLFSSVPVAGVDPTIKPYRYRNQAKRPEQSFTKCHADACEFCGVAGADWRKRVNEPVSSFERANGERLELNNHEYPWIVSLQYFSVARKWVHYCSGSIVSESLIITAAHCNPEVHYNFLTGDPTAKNPFRTIRIVAGTNDWRAYGSKSDHRYKSNYL